MFSNLIGFSVTGPRNFIEAIADLGFEGSLLDTSKHSDSHKDSLTRTKEIKSWRYLLYTTTWRLTNILLKKQIFDQLGFHSANCAHEYDSDVHSRY